MQGAKGSNLEQRLLQRERKKTLKALFKGLVTKEKKEQEGKNNGLREKRESPTQKAL